MNNKISVLPEEIGLLKNLILFNCNLNQLKKLPNTINNLKKLQELELNLRSPDIIFTVNQVEWLKYLKNKGCEKIYGISYLEMLYIK